MSIIGAVALGISAILPCKARGDDIRITSIGGGSVGASSMYIEHADGAAEGGPDGHDGYWSSMPGNPNDMWLKVYTSPYDEDLYADSRPTNSLTPFHGKLQAVDTFGDGVTCTNYLTFNFINSDTNRQYWGDLNMNSNYTANGSPFSWSGPVTNGTRIDTPGIKNVPDSVDYASLDIIPMADVNSSVGANGTINPSGKTWVVPGNSLTSSITGNEGYHVCAVYTNGALAFTNADNNLKSTNYVSNIGTNSGNTVRADFDINKYTIAVSNGAGGNVLPGTVTVPFNGSRLFHVAANPYFEIDEAKTNNAPVTDASGNQAYDISFNNVTANNSLVASFRQKILPNGTPYYWLDGIHHLGTNELADSDSDGYANWQEYILGTDPTNRASNLNLGINKNPTNGSLEVKVEPALADRFYTLTSTTNLINPEWQTNMASYGNGINPLTYTETNAADTAFYRVNVRKE